MLNKKKNIQLREIWLWLLRFPFLKICVIFSYVYAFGSVYVECWCPWRPEALDAPEGGVTGGCTSPGMGGGN